MLIFVSSVIFIIIYLIGPYSHHKLLIKNQEFAINHLIKLDNRYKIKIKTIDDGENGIVRNVGLYQNDREIDSRIVQYKEFQFSYYFCGINGYYIFSKITKKLITCKEISAFNRTQRKKFKKYFF